MRKVTARRAGAAVARQSLRQFDREIAAMDKAAKSAKVAPVVEQVPDAKRELTNTAFGVPPCEDCGQLPCQCPVDAWWQCPAEIQTVQFEMGGKQYQTVSSWRLLD